MLDLCLAPILFAGYAMGVSSLLGQDDSHPSAPLVEVQTCQRGLGAYTNATTNGLYAGGAQYGLTVYDEAFTVTLTPHAGLSYADHPVHALPSRTQFDVGIGAYAGFGRFVSGVTYSHWSNGGHVVHSGYEAQHNHGLDRLELKLGVTF